MRFNAFGSRWIVELTVLSLADRRPRPHTLIPEGAPIKYGRYISEYFGLTIRRFLLRPDDHMRRRYGVRIYRYRHESCGVSIRFWWGAKKYPRRILWGRATPMSHDAEELHRDVALQYFEPHNEQLKRYRPAIEPEE